MSKQPRVVKVLAALLVSMTVGAFVLMALGNNPPSAGPFCLAAYYRLDSVDHAIQSKACQSPHRWNSIEIYFSGTKRGSLEQPAGAVDMNCHFLICNGAGGDNGEIQASESWQKQWSLRPSRTWQGSDRDHPHLPDRRRRHHAAHELPTEAAGDPPGSPLPQVRHLRRLRLPAQRLPVSAPPSRNRGVIQSEAMPYIRGRWL